MAYAISYGIIGGIDLAQGSVLARVFTSDAYLPLANIPVSFTLTDPDGRRTLLAVVRTNSSGLTIPVLVQTPDEEASLSPGNTAPYSTIDIRADVPGYGSVLAEGVQVFPDIVTVQNLQLRPGFGQWPAERISEPPQRL